MPPLYPAKAEHTKWIEKGKNIIILNMRSGIYYKLNETAGKIWLLCNGARTPEDMAAAMSGIYRSDADKLRSGAASAIHIFKKRGIVKL